MIWIVILGIIVVSVLKLLIMIMLILVVKWFFGKFELYFKLEVVYIEIKKGGEILEGEEK